MTRYAQKIKKYVPPPLYKIGAQFYADKKFPRHIFIETTAKCNLTCDYCPREREDSHMDYGMFKEIVDEASRYGPRSFSLHLFGEPLLWPHVIDGIEYIKQCNERHMVILTTNGTRLNSFADKLIRAGLDEIIWTWRPEARFKPETERILLQATRRGNTKTRVRLIKEITPKKEFAKWEKWPTVEIRSLHNYGGNINLAKWGVKNERKRWPCYHLWFAPAVAWNGNFLLCCADPKQRSVLGSIKKNSINELWQKVWAERERHLAGEYIGICKNCDVWKNYPDIFFEWQKSANGRSPLAT